MNTTNNFSVTGRIGQDAKVNQFATASVARFGIAISRKETVNGEEKRTTAFLNVEAWRKNENASAFDQLKKGQLVTLEGYFKPEEYEKDGKKVQHIVFAVTSWELVKKDEKE